MSDLLEPNDAERLTSALFQASRSAEYAAARASGDDYACYQALATVALRDGRTSRFVVPNKRVPGFLEANSELVAAIGKRFVLVVDSETHEVTRCYLESAKVVDGMIVAEDAKT